MRENGEKALFVSCGEISEIEVEGNSLVAKTDKEYIFDLISNGQNVLTIKRALRFLGFEIDFKIEKTTSKDFEIVKDLEILKDKFKDVLTVED